jgi:hypothetical protein
MTSLEALYVAFSELSTATWEGTRPPTVEDVARAESALGRSIPKELIDFQLMFHDRHPPFWNVLSVQPQGAPPVSEDIVTINLTQRTMYPGELDHVLLFYHAGQGNYDCFIFDSRGRVLGIGRWDPFDDNRETPPDIRYDSWVAWLTDEIRDLQNL